MRYSARAILKLNRRRLLPNMGSKKVFRKSNSKREGRPLAPSSSVRSRSPHCLQDTIGNAATGRLIKPGYLQPKLTISHPEDENEREADRAANQVMRLSEPQLQPAAAHAQPKIQRAYTECEEELQRRPDFAKNPIADEDEEIVAQAKSEQSSEADDQETRQVHPGNAVSTRRLANSLAEDLNGLKDGGSPLPEATRAFFEPRFGADFGKVRVHTDAVAVETAKSINAQAFTVGSNIAFGPGRYAPHSEEGQRLLAHELTHVVQQGGGNRGNDLVPISPLKKTHGALQRWEGLEHKSVGNRAQNKFPYRGTVLVDMTALRSTPRKDPNAPNDNTKADILAGAKVLALGEEKGWVQVLVESGNAKDKKGQTVSAEKLTGYISRELITKSKEVFDATVPVGGGLDLSYGDLVAFGGDHFKDFTQIAGEASMAAGRARIKRRALPQNRPPVRQAIAGDVAGIAP